jgi:hypothetical protein
MTDYAPIDLDDPDDDGSAASRYRRISAYMADTQARICEANARDFDRRDQMRRNRFQDTTNAISTPSDRTSAEADKLRQRLFELQARHAGGAS